MSSSTTSTLAEPFPSVSYAGLPLIDTLSSPSPSFTWSASVVSARIAEDIPGLKVTVVSGIGPTFVAKMRVAALMILWWPKMLTPTVRLDLVEPILLKVNFASVPSVNVETSALTDTIGSSLSATSTVALSGEPTT